MGFVILAVTDVAGIAGLGVAVAGTQRQADDNRRAACSGAWDRYDGRNGLRVEGIADRAAFMDTVIATLQIKEPVASTLRTALIQQKQDSLDLNLPAYKEPTCPRPAGSSTVSPSSGSSIEPPPPQSIPPTTRPGP